MIGALAGILLGGAIGIAGTLLTQTRAERREDRLRWDHERLGAVSEVLEVATQLEGWHYRRGRALFGGETEAIAARTAQAESGLNALYAGIAKAKLLLPQLDQRLTVLFSTERELRQVADEPLDGQTAAWLVARQEHRSAIDAVAAGARTVLRVPDSD